MWQWLKKLKELFSPPAKPATSAQDHLKRGLGKLAIGDLSGALREWNKAIEQDPDCAPAYYYRALVLEDNGELDAAISDLLVALEIFERQQDKEYSQKIRQKLAALNQKLENADTSSQQ